MNQDDPVTVDEILAAGRVLAALPPRGHLTGEDQQRIEGAIIRELRAARQAGSVDGILAGLAEGERKERARCVAAAESWIALPYTHVGKDAAANLLAILRDPTAKVGEEDG